MHLASECSVFASAQFLQRVDNTVRVINATTSLSQKISNNRRSVNTNNSIEYKKNKHQILSCSTTTRAAAATAIKRMSSLVMKILLVWIGLAATAVDACGNFTSCNDCLDNLCVWVPVEGCLESCDIIADTSCFDVENFANENVTIEEICVVSDNGVADQELCSSQTDCASCVGSVLSDGETTCQWFADGSYCGSGCGMNGCGELTCSSSSPPPPPPDACESKDNCSDCLTDSLCGWAPFEGCVANCNFLADTPCFTTKNGVSVEEACSVSEETQADVKLCSSQTDCSSCVGTTLSDGISICQWFEDGAFCASGCGINGCGSATCADGMVQNASSAVKVGSAALALTVSFLVSVFPSMGAFDIV
mmetsp:Transcript_12239/g.21506  ORF Transcript_12239/g.21506 Transcript_12239/m.21506 type:complete len:364 (-) Transcript_12239:80-1171(-)